VARGSDTYDPTFEVRTGPPHAAHGGVRPELVGREVSVRPLIPLWEAVRATGAAPERLASGTGYGAHHFTDPRERISWAAFARFLANLGELLSDDELVALGAAALEAPLIRVLLLPARFLFGVADMYRWVFGPIGPGAQLFTANEVRIVELAPGRLRLEVYMKPGYAPSRENFLLLRGSLSGLSKAMGAEPAQVTQQTVERGAIYDIAVSQHRGALGFVRRQLSWVTAARSNAEELQRAHAELHERYVELQREIEARAQVEAQLRRLNEDLEHRVAERTAELEYANSELAAFSYSVSHDLQAPLRGMNAFSQALIEDHGDQLDGRALDYVGRIRSAAQRMGELTDGLLQLARVTGAQLRHEAVDLSTTARSVIDELVRGEPDRRVAAAIDDRMAAIGDGRLIRIVLQNLIGNAWKFTRGREPAEIHVGTRREHERTVYFVRDNGAGFDMQHAARLFEPFHRLHHGDEFPGNGIGLATVQRIISRHGGQIWAESARRAGATFSFTLPVPT
jgi:signal transduction histidine kinase